ncbi:MAG: hypothetical protein ACI36X_06990 [Bacteroidaceae bacterium]
MNRLILLAFVGLASLGGLRANAQNKPEKTDSIATAIRIKSLQQQKQQLRTQIAEADKQRNRHIEGVSAARLEQINDRQDSICLDLRSQLVTVELELQEIQPNPVNAVVAQQYNAFMQQHQEQASPAAPQKK